VLLSGIAAVVVLSIVPLNPLIGVQLGGDAPGWLLVALPISDFVAWVVLLYPTFWILDRAMRVPFARYLGWSRAALLLVAIPFIASLARVIAWPPFLGLPDELRELGFRRSSITDPYWMAEVVLLSAINCLIYFVLQRVQHGQDAAVRAGELQVAVAEARLSALSSELQPHFLFNTLNGLAELIVQDSVRAERMVLDLSALLRLTLRDLGQRTTPLAIELERTDLYLALQQVRFGDRMHVQRQISPAAVDAAVPPMLLQPIVENAIKHGVEQRATAVTITISAVREGNRVVIRVTDTAAGLGSSHSTGTGLGISHTRARLEAIFGTDASIVLHSTADAETRVELQFPYVQSRMPDGGSQ
jgi:two-component system, LytTR family, sensor kinase